MVSVLDSNRIQENPRDSKRFQEIPRDEQPSSSSSSVRHLLVVQTPVPLAGARPRIALTHRVCVTERGGPNQHGPSQPQRVLHFRGGANRLPSTRLAAKNLLKTFSWIPARALSSLALALCSRSSLSFPPVSRLSRQSARRSTSAWSGGPAGRWASRRPRWSSTASLETLRGSKRFQEIPRDSKTAF